MKFIVCLILSFFAIAGSLQAQNNVKNQAQVREVQIKKAHVIEKASKPEVKKEEDVVYDQVDEMPTYKIGNKAFYSLMRQNFMTLQDEGIVADETMNLEFIVGKDGKVRDMVLIGKDGKKVTDSPVLAYHMPYWSIGRKDQKAVSTKMHIPVKWILEENEK
ncbi:MAG: hypothetical protein J5I59_00395 [Saprospiraceae bacterium]|nr:hypothetical protein [Saprospiraceae bacterium]